MRLHDLAHARTGDKGDTSNISVIAYRPDDWPLLERALTPEVVAAQLGLGQDGGVERFALPQLHALNFVILGALAGGVTRSLALDAHGKCLASVLLQLDMDDMARD
ncbi:hypothetical protein [Maritimibacter alkaliphilus]|uniref:AtuA-related protein n=1 Tax=Maritimibacter alkaliphilus TaxID=404236 RepID=UPI001C94FEB9|nr:hypothetical protein [Maritimibacter alkaliphilus]MBY6092551.1 hypothetical protein [Maritimibacter alkaliphilus]